MKRTLLLVSALLLLTLNSPAFAVGSFEHLEDLGGHFFGHYITLSFDGTAYAANGNTFWSEATGLITAAEGNLSKITGNGLKVVGTVMDPAYGQDVAGVWDPVTNTWIMIPPLGTEGCPGLMSGYAGNFDGTMVTGLGWLGCDATAFLWTQGVGTVDLGRNDVEDRSSRGSDLSDDGTTVGGFFENNACGRRNAIWVNGGPVEFPMGEESCGEVLGVSSDGQMLCGKAPGPLGLQEAYYYDTTVGYVHIGTLPTDEFNGSYAAGVADNSWTVGQNSDAWFGFPEAFIWTPEDGMMSFKDFLDLKEVVYPEGAYFYNCTDISADGSTIVGNWLPEGGQFVEAFKVVIEGVVPTFMGELSALALDGFVELTFDINGHASASDFELIAELDGTRWNVPLTGADTRFTARDSSPMLAQGGTVTYYLYHVSEGGNTLLETKSMNLPTAQTRLIGASPNPFNPMTTVSISLGSNQQVKVSVYDLAGRRIAELANETMPAGTHAFEWNGTDFNGRAVASATYTIHMETAEGIQSKKMSLVR